MMNRMFVPSASFDRSRRSARASAHGIGVIASLVLAMTAITPAVARINGVPTVSAQLLTNNLGYQVLGGDDFSPFPQNVPVIDISRGNNRAEGMTFEALSDFGNNSVLFKNSVIGSGAGTRLTATIGVQIIIDNTFGPDFKPVLNTKLLAAGMGTFVNATVLSKFGTKGNVTQAPNVLDCTASQLKNCAPLTDPAIAAQLQSPSDVFGRLSTGFDFNVTVGGVSKYRMQASMGYDANGDYFEDIAEAEALANFRRSDTQEQIFTTAYAWDDTFVPITLGEMLKAGEKLTAVYTITTFVDIDKNSGGLIGVFPTAGGSQLMKIAPGAFAAFGDPIGGQGPIVDDIESSGIARGSLSSFSLASTQQSESEQLRINTNGTGVFDLPFFTVDPESGNPVVIFDGKTVLPPPDPFPYGRLGPNVVPEPSTWAMFIIGFGGIGSVLRRRNRLAKGATPA